VDLLTELLYANSTCAKARSHCLDFAPTMHRKRLPRLHLTTSIYPSVCGWYALLNYNRVSIFFHRVLQKWLKNLTSRYKVIDFGTPCSLTISSKNNTTTLVAYSVFLHARKWVILENLSTTTKMESLPYWVYGSPKTKSMLRSTQGLVGIDKGIYKLVFWTWPLVVWHTLHRLNEVRRPQILKTLNFLVGICISLDWHTISPSLIDLTPTSNDTNDPPHSYWKLGYHQNIRS